MSCNCKNVIEVFQGGDIPLPTRFYSGVTLTELCHTVGGTKNLLKILLSVIFIFGAVPALNAQAPTCAETFIVPMYN